MTETPLQMAEYVVSLAKSPFETAYPGRVALPIARRLVEAEAKIVELEASHTKYVLERALVEVTKDNRILALETAGRELLTASFDEDGDDATGTAIVRLAKVLNLERTKMPAKNGDPQ